MADNAQYWVTTNNQLLHIKFPAKVDRTGQYKRLGPYFNLTSSGLDINVLQKMRAQFELVALDDEVDQGCPSTAIECSRAFFTALFVFFDEAESRELLGNKNATVMPFWYTYDPSRGDHYALVVTTDALFMNLPHVNSMAAPKVTHADVGKSTILLSPSKARAASSAQASADAAVTICGGAAHKTSAPKALMLRDLPDPHGRYVGLLKTYGALAATKVTIPDVRDRQGVLITPAEYHNKISDGDIVEVEVILKLWSIPPNPKGNPNGSRVYQTILCSLKLLPFHAYSQENVFSATDKGKRKADDKEVLSGQSPIKKSVPVPRVSADDEMVIIGEDRQ
ncbi:hypothetical protein EDC04DRAFT_2698632 [Pisolithus marmoratus]|nr:hypothetical protein EDC04DRAFT_2698632 [Pisolithus marmoratus]